MSNPLMDDFIVIRAGPGLSEGFLPKDLDGRWYNLRDVPQAYKEQESGGVAVPTGKFEVRDDGAIAEVWEIQI